MIKKQISIISGALLLIISFIAVPMISNSEDKKEKKIEEKYSAQLLSLTGTAGRHTGTLYMTMETWTPDEQRIEFFNIFKEKGAEELQKVMRKNNAGYVRFSGTLSWPVNIAAKIPTDKGTLIRLVTERPITFVEYRGGSRSRDYEFGLIEFLMPEQGEGEGMLIGAAKITLDKDGKLIVESLGMGDTKLLHVKKSK